MPTERTGWHSEGTGELSPVPSLARIQFCGIKHIVHIKYKISYGIFFFYIDKNIDGQNTFSTYLRREMLKKNRNSQELKCVPVPVPYNILYVVVLCCKRALSIVLKRCIKVRDVPLKKLFPVAFSFNIILVTLV